MPAARLSVTHTVLRRTGAGGRFCLAALAALFVLPEQALAHPGQIVTPEDVWWAWNWDPVLLLNLTFLAWLYQRGLSRHSQRETPRQRTSNRQAVAFAASLATIFLALASPIDALGETLLAVHMFQHMLLMMVAAPLFILGNPLRVMPRGLEPPARKIVARPLRWRWCRTLARGVWQPAFVWMLSAVVLWAWHLPQLYEAALANPFVHDLQHLTFFASAALFWRVVLDPVSRRRLDRGAGILFLFTASLQTMMLGVLMALSPVAWYPGYEGRTLAWNLNTLEDQQLAGFLMWMPGGMMYGLVAAVLLVLWLEESRHSDRGGLSVCRTGPLNSARSS